MTVPDLRQLTEMRVSIRLVAHTHGVTEDEAEKMIGHEMRGRWTDPPSEATVRLLARCLTRQFGITNAQATEAAKDAMLRYGMQANSLE